MFYGFVKILINQNKNAVIANLFTTNEPMNSMFFKLHEALTSKHLQTHHLKMLSGFKLIAFHSNINSTIL